MTPAKLYIILECKIELNLHFVSTQQMKFKTNRYQIVGKGINHFWSWRCGVLYVGLCVVFVWQIADSRTGSGGDIWYHYLHDTRTQLFSFWRQNYSYDFSNKNYKNIYWIIFHFYLLNALKHYFIAVTCQTCGILKPMSILFLFLCFIATNKFLEKIKLSCTILHALLFKFDWGNKQK